MTRSQRLVHARRVVERIRRVAAADARERREATTPFGQPVASTKYPEAKRTEQPLVLNAIVAPTDRTPFAVIEHESTGIVASYPEGSMLWPGVLPGVWVVDVDPGKVHLLNLRSNRFEFLTFEKPLTPRERRALERRERARKRSDAAKRRREARRKKRRR